MYRRFANLSPRFLEARATGAAKTTGAGPAYIVRGAALLALCLLGDVLVSSEAVAQNSIPSPDRKVMFREDTGAAKRSEKRAATAVTRRDAGGSSALDLRAPKLEYSRDGKTMTGSGGVTLQSGAMSVEASKVSIQTETKDATFNGAVRVNRPEVKISAAAGASNLNSEAGTFTCAQAQFEDSNYQVAASEIEKFDDERFAMKDVAMTTCSCPDGSTPTASVTGDGLTCDKSGVPPWSLEANRLSLTRNGYAHAYGTTFRFHGVPFFYTPYIGFPIKEERQSGLLVPQLGYSSQDGFTARVPVFIALSESADVTLTPFTESKTRTGSIFDYRQKFSRYNQLESRFYFSDESAREGSLRGTNTSGLFDPTYDEERFAAYLQHFWRTERDSALDLTYIADVHYVGDDLFLREMGDSDIGDPADTSTTSRALIRAGLGEYGTAELSTEFVQALDQQDDDRVFKRLPELNVNLSKTFRPIGYNDYGLKAVTRLDYLADEFYRKEGYDGFRSHLAPSVTVPFHIDSYVQGFTSVSLLRTDYRLDGIVTPNEFGEPEPTQPVLDDNAGRTLPVFTAGLSTALERVYSVSSDSWLASISSPGNDSDATLRRVKHTIEPFTRFTAVPNEDQDDLPLFDSIDRIKEKRALSYGVRSSLFGRFLNDNDLPQRNEALVGDASGNLSGLTPLATSRAGEDLGAMTRGARVMNGDTRELLTFVAKQNFDILEQSRNFDQDSNGLSDVDAAVYLFPTPRFALGLESSIDMQDGGLSSWAVMTDLANRRGDVLRARWTFVQDVIQKEDLISQFEGNAEVSITNDLKAGVYSRLDELHGDALENRAALRWIGSCRCWHIDLGYGQRRNPDRREVLLSFTLHGLGDLAQAIQLGGSSK